ncbi:DNA repair protein RadC [Candidatus Saccharibacteria bacterium]|jgi:DNA repair protein RadC|nr:DNA repair protein RadC [Candidatus Saccharibacteria bacterium]
MKMSDRRKDLRPREKLQARGAEALSDYELLMAIIGSGNAQADVTKIARDVLKILKRDRSLTVESLSCVIGLGPAKIAELVASYELASRYLLDPEQPIIDSPEVAAAQLADIRTKQQEYFVCLTLDGANRLIAKRIITIGTLTSSLVHPREVFADAITDRAASIIVAHNHPSGNLQASDADRAVTERLQEAGELLGIKLLDHMIVTVKSYRSII